MPTLGIVSLLLTSPSARWFVALFVTCCHLISTVRGCSSFTGKEQIFMSSKNSYDGDECQFSITTKTCSLWHSDNRNRKASLMFPYSLGEYLSAEHILQDHRKTVFQLGQTDHFGPFTDLCWDMSRPPGRQSVTLSTGRAAAIVFCPDDWWRLASLEVVIWGYDKQKNAPKSPKYKFVFPVDNWINCMDYTLKATSGEEIYD